MIRAENNGFDTRYEKILDRIAEVDPVSYARTRNYVDGKVTRLSPYISRGVISTDTVLQLILQRDLPFNSIEKFVQELAWRDYWQQTWIAKEDAINNDLKHPQIHVSHHELPDGLERASTGIEVMDQAIEELYRTGYMHNHMRMYTASVACNIARSHWRVPAQWMYYHLLDGDWASNALSWQWVAGSNSNKKYYANQDNINKYFHSNQAGTFLDTSYPELELMPIPATLCETLQPALTTELPSQKAITIDSQIPTLVYNYYNLDPEWRKDETANHVLLLEPSIFRQYPVAKKNIDFALMLAENIPGIQVFTGEFDELMQMTSASALIYKEHPLNRHYTGSSDPREWMFSTQGYYPSFFAYWKQCKKEIRHW